MVARNFIDRYVQNENQLRTADEVERKIALHLLPAWGKRPIAEITRADVRERVLKSLAPNIKV